MSQERVEAVRRAFEEKGIAVSDIRASADDVVFVAAVKPARERNAADERVWYVVRFQEGLVERVETYFAAAQALEAAGLSE